MEPREQRRASRRSTLVLWLVALATMLVALVAFAVPMLLTP